MADPDKTQEATAPADDQLVELDLDELDQVAGGVKVEVDPHNLNRF